MMIISVDVPETDGVKLVQDGFDDDDNKCVDVWESDGVNSVMLVPWCGECDDK